MADNELQDQLMSYLRDMHSTEQNALTQLRTGADQAGEPALRQVFEQHLAETEQHARLVAECLDRHGENTSTLKDVAQKGGAMLSGMAAKAAPDTTGKLAIQAFAFEHLEIASYRMLAVVAQRAGDEQTVQVARQILEQEQAAADKLGSLLEQVAEYDLRELGAAA
jgi:ferritin-like metal-binding protein YciE